MYVWTKFLSANDLLGPYRVVLNFGKKSFTLHLSFQVSFFYHEKGQMDFVAIEEIVVFIRHNSIENEIVLCGSQQPVDHSVIFLVVTLQNVWLASFCATKWLA